MTTPHLARAVLACLSLLSLRTARADPAAEEAQLRADVRGWYQRQLAGGGQYMRCGCKPSDRVLPGWESLPVERCDYTTEVFHIPVSTTAYLLFPDADQLTAWTVNACKDAEERELRRCAGRLMWSIWDASGAQFPVAGFVVEPPQRKDWKYQDQPYCILFRDGVSVNTRRWGTQRQVDHRCGPTEWIHDAPTTAFDFGRISSTTRQAFRAAEQRSRSAAERTDLGGGERHVRWSSVVGAEFRRAWRSDRNFLLYATVVGGFEPRIRNALDEPERAPKPQPSRACREPPKVDR